ncbi:hypothetical protein NQ314_008613 [Rhamnusium bicolor]|uniref:S-protein homolog n=1 Tax=Rhamnusium bicolor TaxID=1586634 RepID=A0AAV8YAQ3_9CUCU|nr:hypothetical protein NQ314_008613 [Rhamnusium bicolor]
MGSIFTDPYAIISNRTCPKIYMMKEEQYVFHLDDRGIFKIWQNKSKSFIHEDIGHLRSYCIEHTKTAHFDGYLFFMCFPEVTTIGEKFEYTVWAKNTFVYIYFVDHFCIHDFE